jgi:hypothetical protein
MVIICGVNQRFVSEFESQIIKECMCHVNKLRNTNGKTQLPSLNCAWVLNVGTLGLRKRV